MFCASFTNRTSFDVCGTLAFKEYKLFTFTLHKQVCLYSFILYLYKARRGRSITTTTGPWYTKSTITTTTTTTTITNLHYLKREK